MEQRFFEFAGLRLCIRIPAAYMPPTMGALEPFSGESGDWDHLMEFAVVDALDAPEGIRVFHQPDKQVFQCADTHIRYDGAVACGLEGATVRIARRGSRSAVQVKRSAIPAGITSKLVMTCMEAEHLIAERGGFLLHASVIRFRDKAVLFTAPSGTGKSTQADLWCRYRGAELINGDRTSVRNGFVWGIPFCGSSAVAKRAALPLAAIVYLSQATENSVTRLTGLRAFRQVWEGCSVNVWNREDMGRCTQAVMDTVSAVPVLWLACRPDESAVAALQDALEKEGAL